MVEKINDSEFDKLNKFEKISDNTLTEISEKDLLGENSANLVNDTNISEPEPIKPSNANEPNFAFKHKESGEPSTINLAAFLNPELVIEGLDSLLPLLFVYGLSAANISIKKNQMQLSPKEKQTIEPLVEACLEEMNILIKSPFAALGIMLAIFYSSKAVEFGIKANEVKKSENNENKQPVKVKDSRGRKLGSTKEVLAQKANLSPLDTK